MNLQSINASASPEVQMNENFDALDWAAVYAKNAPTTTGLTWGYFGGRWGGFAVAAGTLTLANGAINRIVVAKSTGVVSLSVGSPDPWSDTTNYRRVYQVTTAAGLVTAIEDHRAGPNGVHGQ